MAMTLRLDREHEAIVRDLAERTRRSPAEVVVLAIWLYRDELVRREEELEEVRQGEYRTDAGGSIVRDAEFLEHPEL